MIGHSFMSWKKYFTAYSYFKKLVDVSRMEHDLETTMYAYKQCGHCLISGKDYHKAEKAFKC